jgi:hypothetical protein
VYIFLQDVSKKKTLSIPVSCRFFVRKTDGILRTLLLMHDGDSLNTNPCIWFLTEKIKVLSARSLRHRTQTPELLRQFGRVRGACQRAPNQRVRSNCTKARDAIHSPRSGFSRAQDSTRINHCYDSTNSGAELSTQKCHQTSDTYE